MILWCICDASCSTTSHSHHMSDALFCDAFVMRMCTTTDGQFILWCICGARGHNNGPTASATTSPRRHQLDTKLHQYPDSNGIIIPILNHTQIQIRFGTVYYALELIIPPRQEWVLTVKDRRLFLFVLVPGPSTSTIIYGWPADCINPTLVSSTPSWLLNKSTPPCAQLDDPVLINIKPINLGLSVGSTLIRVLSAHRILI